MFPKDASCVSPKMNALSLAWLINHLILLFGNLFLSLTIHQRR